MTEQNSLPDGMADGFVDAVHGTVDWRGLEQAAFEGHPEVQRAVSDGIDAVMQGAPKGELPKAILLGLAELGPLLAFGAVFIGRTATNDYALPLILVTLFGIIFIAQQLTLWRLMARDVREIDPRRVVFAWVNAAVSLFTLFWVSTLGSEMPLWWFAALITAATTLVSILTALRMRRLGKRVSGEQLETAMKSATPVGRSRAAVESLSDEQRAVVRARLDALVRALETRGTIDKNVADDALRQPLGSLGRWELAMRQRAEKA